MHDVRSVKLSRSEERGSRFGATRLAGHVQSQLTRLQATLPGG